MIAASAKIHPLSVVDDGAVVGENVACSICSTFGGRRSFWGDDVELLTHVVVSGRTTMRPRHRRIFPSAVIGGDPQSIHLHCLRGEPTLIVR